LKLEISCVEKGLDDNREDDDPSPTTVNANLSRFTKDASPAPDSLEDEQELPLPTFDGKCVGESVEVSPRKGKA